MLTEIKEYMPDNIQQAIEQINFCIKSGNIAPNFKFKQMQSANIPARYNNRYQPYRNETKSDYDKKVVTIELKN